MAKSKYKNQATTLDGIWFHSKREANRYAELKLLEQAGQIADLELQPKYSIDVGGVHVCDYVADFRYTEELPTPGGTIRETIVEDAKGFRTDVYKLKRRLMQAVFAIEIKEV